MIVSRVVDWLKGSLAVAREREEEEEETVEAESREFGGGGVGCGVPGGRDLPLEFFGDLGCVREARERSERETNGRGDLGFDLDLAPRDLVGVAGDRGAPGGLTEGGLEGY